MPYRTITELPNNVKNVLPVAAQRIYLSAFNRIYKATRDDTEAIQAGWGAVKNAGYKRQDDKWVKSKESFAEINDMEIFKAGLHHKGTSDEKNWTLDDLKQVVKNTMDAIKKKEFEPFIKLGHSPDASAPKLGIIDYIKLVGDKIIAHAKDVPTKLALAINNKSYNPRSAEIYHNYKGRGHALHAVAILGAHMPEVKGLNDIIAQYEENGELLYVFYKDGDDTLDDFSFAEQWEETDDFHRHRIREPNLFKEGSFRNTDFDGQLPEGVQYVRGRLKTDNSWATQSVIFSKENWTLERAKSWVKDRTFDESLKLVEFLSNKVEDLQNTLDETKSKKEDEVMPMDEKELKEKEERLAKEKKEFEVKKEKAAEDKKKFDEDKKKQDEEKKTFDENKKKEAADSKKKEVDDFIERAKKEKKILPSEEGTVRFTLERLDFEKTEKFGEKQEEKTPAQVYMDSILSRPDQSVFGEQARIDKDGKKVDKTGAEMFNEAIDKYMVDNEKVTDRAVAMKAVADAQPDLYEKYAEETKIIT